MDSVLLQRLESIIQICFLIKDDIFEKEIERKNAFRATFNADLWKHAENFSSEQENNQVESALSFTEKEIESMPNKFKKEYKIGRVKAHVRKHNGGYEIRCQLFNVKISVSAKNIAEAKRRFLERVRDEFRGVPQPKPKRSVTHAFGKYALLWLEATKKPYVKDNTYHYYVQAINAYALPRFGSKNIEDIKQLELQKFFNEFQLSGKFRTARTVYQILSAIFEYAVADEIINRSPMAKVKIGSYEEQHGTPLTRVEEKNLVAELLAEPSDVWRQAYVFFVYTGIRRSELSSISIADGWISVSSAKQRKGRSEKIRRIPISPMLKKVLPLIDVAAIRALPTEPLSNRFKRFNKVHHLHDLRHTFITRCQECGIPREFVSIWAGHAADRTITTIVYTHLEQFEQKQLEEISKVEYEL